MKDNKHYSIGEVSRLLNVKEHTLRYWEKEFSMLNPKRTSKNRRYYLLEDLKLLQRIKKLVYDEQLTIKGAMQKLEREEGSEEIQLKVSEDKSSMESRREKTRTLEDTNRQALLNQKKEASNQFYHKISKEILFRVYDTVQDLIEIWENFPDDSDE